MSDVIPIAIGIDASEALKGRDQTVRALADITAAAEKAWAAMGKPLPNPGATSNFYEQSTRQARSFVDVNERASASVMQGYVRQGQAAEKAAADKERAIKRIIDAYTPYLAELERLNRDEATLNGLIAQGGPQADMYGQALNRLQQRKAFVTAESKRMAEGAKMSAYEMRNLSYQINDVVSGLMMGQSPWMIFTQQGGQFVQIFQAGGTAVSGAVVAVAALAGGLLAAEFRAASLSRQLRDINNSLQLSGRSGFAASLVQSGINSAAAGSSATRSETSDASSVLSKQTQINTVAMNDALRLTTALADVTGGKAVEAANTFSKALDGGYDGLVKFNNAYRVLEPVQLSAIRDLYEQGRAADAATMAMTLAGRKLQELADERLTPMDRLLRSVAAGWNLVADAASRPFREPTLEEQRADAADKLRKAQTNFYRDDSADNYRKMKDAEHEVELLDAQIAGVKALAAERDRIRNIQDQRERDSNASRLNNQARDIGYLPPNLRGEVQAYQDQVNANINNPNQAIDPELARQRVTDQMSMQARDATAAASMQADAEERLARAVGHGTLAQQAAARQNTVIAAVYQNRLTDTKALTAALEREDAAKLLGMRKDYADETRRQADESRALAEAWRIGNVEAIRQASVTSDAIVLARKLAISEDEARRMILGRGAASAAPEIQKGLTLLERQVELSTRLAHLEGRGDVTGMRKAQVTADLESYKVSNPTATQQDIERQRRLLEAGSTTPDLKSAYAVHNQNPTVARDMANAELDRLAAVKDAEGKLILTQEDIAARRQAINDAYVNAEIQKLEATRNWADGAEAALMRYSYDAKNYGALAGNAVTSGLRSMENALVSFSMQTATASQAFKSMAASIISDLVRMQIQANITGPLSSGLSGLFSNLFGGGGVSYSPNWNSSVGAGASYDPQLLATTTPFADGGIMTQWGKVPLRTYSDGGIANSPQAAIFGEGSVPEAYVPVPSGKIPVEMRGPALSPRAEQGGGGGGQVNQTNHLTIVQQPGEDAEALMARARAEFIPLLAQTHRAAVKDAVSAVPAAARSPAYAKALRGSY